MSGGSLGVDVVQAYAQRVTVEDLDLIEKHGGVEGLFGEFQSSSLGLLTNQVEGNREKFGANETPKKETTPLWKLIWVASSDPMLRVLMVASIVSLSLALAFGENKKVEWIEGFSILMAVIIVIGVTAGNDYMKEKQFAELYAKEEKYVQVYRDHEKVKMPVSEVVGGDLIYLEAGDELPADAVLLKGNNLKVDESSLTGEPDQVLKMNFGECMEKLEAYRPTHPGAAVGNTSAAEARTDSNAGVSRAGSAMDHHTVPSPVLLSGSNVASGSGTALVVAVGLQSQMGKLFTKLVVDNEPTPLQNKLNGMARDVGRAGFTAALVTLIVLLVEYGVQLHEHSESARKICATLVRHLVTAITIVVVAVPEGLPLAVTISLAFSVGRMLKDQNYVRRLAACETMGGASEVCSDKTGTLTKNQMEVESYWNGSFLMEGSENIAWPSEPYRTILIHNIVVNSSGFLVHETAQVAQGQAKQITKQVGSPTDCALLGLIETLGNVDSTALRNIYRGIAPPASDTLLCRPLPPGHQFSLDDRSVSFKAKAATRGSHSIELAQRTAGSTAGSAARSDSASDVAGSIPAAAPAVSGPAEVKGVVAASAASGRLDPGVRTISFANRSSSSLELCVNPATQAAAGSTPSFPRFESKQCYIVRQLPFSSEKKAMTTIVQHPSDPSQVRVFVKGAAEVVLRRCGRRIDSDGGLKELTAHKVGKIEDVIVARMASLALRTICLAYRDATLTPEQVADAPNLSWAPFETDLTCLGIVGIRDPLREEVPKAIRDCQRAGVRVRMCTGDNIETAKQIALKAGLYHPEDGGIAMLGPEFLKLVGGVVCARCQTEHCPCEVGGVAVTQAAAESEGGARAEDGGKKEGDKKEGDKSAEVGGKFRVSAAAPTGPRQDVLRNAEEFALIADKLEVMARSQPNDKYALVTGLRNLGRVVAVTGDGVNDAPALKKADVGFAMGITGKETAKQAADIVLMDDNFSSIVKAIKWGRNVYDNIQRFLQFQLTVNIVAVITAFVGACFLRASPLTAIQMLWVNLIMDTFAALALATEMPTDRLLDRPPHSRQEYLVTRAMWRNIMVQALYQVAVMMSVIFSGECWLPEYNFKYNTSVDPNFTVFSGCGHNHVRSGRLYHPFTTREDYKASWNYDITPSRHYTYVFNIFVMMQAFNLLNARKIQDKDFNIFQGLHRNPYWVGIMFIIVVGQALMVEFGSQALSVHKDGLTWQQWFICIAFGAGTWVVAALGKLIPTRIITQIVPETHNREVNPLTEPASLALASRGRISSGRISSRMNLRSTADISSTHLHSFLQPPKSNTNL
ncbi:ATPase [Gregarina niphandrodes]|uniref:ATPase n=1 Tax=Gregarina niphandrodes TaxID=110365 RepID=A0A023B291_GRENI|nr:ATPase [Gregarina niphandrodes]EZG51713.1 ATPase [Gregarina niphandrodes]|eukprot:XP_011131926.1 ATPase [Gregarina niphandrodes]